MTMRQRSQNSQWQRLRKRKFWKVQGWSALVLRTTGTATTARPARVDNAFVKADRAPGAARRAKKEASIPIAGDDAAKKAGKAPKATREAEEEPAILILMLADGRTKGGDADKPTEKERGAATGETGFGLIISTHSAWAFLCSDGLEVWFQDRKYLFARCDAVVKSRIVGTKLDTEGIDNIKATPVFKLKKTHGSSPGSATQEQASR